MKREETPIRRAQLISPFGVGAIITNREGVSNIVSALDFWYKDVKGNNKDINEYKSRRDRRLIKALSIDHYRFPPDYREKFGPQGHADKINSGIRIPAYRFPTFHICQGCGALVQFKLTTVELKKQCPRCGLQKNNYSIWQQVRFIVVCDNGHLNDFPWQEWIENSKGDCKVENGEKLCSKPGKLKYNSSGGTNLAAIKVKCDCGKLATLAGTTRTLEGNEKSKLSNKLGRNCNGYKPWTGKFENEDCGRPINTSLLNASNVYFPNIKSSLLMPFGFSKIDQLLELFEQEQGVKSTIKFGKVTKEYLNDYLEGKNHPKKEVFKNVKQADIDSAIEKFKNGSSEEEPDPEDHAYRYYEYNVLIESPTTDEIVIEDTNINDYSGYVKKYFEEIKLVKKLIETRVITGFDRKYPRGNENIKFPHRRKQLWKNYNSKWVPGTEFTGEGIFFRIKKDVLNEWETREDVVNRANLMNKNYMDSFFYDPDKSFLSPRFVMLHTLSHLLLNELVYHCGYSTAALRERLYVHDDDEKNMEGILIYTASGDSDGSMGGLVSMGQPGKFETIFENALRKSEWCSADPICSEIEGQGPESLNLSACHNCSLIPETACEEMNMFLDRGLVTGNEFSNYKSEGFFNNIINKK
jgi:hypothetical protein